MSEELTLKKIQADILSNELIDNLNANFEYLNQYTTINSLPTEKIADRAITTEKLSFDLQEKFSNTRRFFVVKNQMPTTNRFTDINGKTISVQNGDVIILVTDMWGNS